MFEEKPIEIFSDRDTIRNEIIEYASQYLELEGFDFTKSSYLSYIINVLSTLTANLLYYNSSVYREFFLTRAITKEAVLNLASMLGYSPKFSIPSTTQVMLQIELSFSSSVTFKIPKRHKYYADKIIFEQIGEVNITVLNPNTNTVNIQIKETFDTGVSKIIPFQYNEDRSSIFFFVSVIQEETTNHEYVIPKLNPYEFYDLQIDFNGNISTLTVLTTQSQSRTGYDIWKEYDSLFLIPNNIKGYSIRSNVRGAKIFFGNGIIGVQPNEGEICNIKVGISKGSDGNVISSAIDRMDSVYVAVIEGNKTINKPVNIACTNVQPAQGGEDAPTIDEIKTGAMANVSSAKRLTSGADFDNIKYIVENLPVQHALHVLKRSDIKQNEICLFTDIIFENYIVPIRNTTLNITTSEDNYYIFAGTNVTIDGVQYLTMFDIYINTYFKKVRYYYLAKALNVDLTISKMFIDDVKVMPVYASFTLVRASIRDNDYVQLSLYYQKVVNENYTSTLTCIQNIDWSGEQITMTHFPNENKFVSNMYVRNIPANYQWYKFIFNYSGNEYCNFQCETILKRDISEYMDSQLNITDGTAELNCTIIDVPVIQKEYYDNIDQNTFETQIIHKIVSFDIVSYRMLTDFINLKFSNTTGKLSNMLNNPVEYDVHEINPVTLPIATHGARYLVTQKFNPWDKKPPFFAIWSNTSSSWITNNIPTNSVIFDLATMKKYIFNGEIVVEPVYDIPFHIKAVVWRVDGSAVSSQLLSTSIKDKIIDRLYAKFGYDKNIYRSEIIAAIHEVEGVSHCRLLQPESDIFFVYKDRIYELFTKEQLMLYSPDLVYTDTSHINIEIR